MNIWNTGPPRLLYFNHVSMFKAVFLLKCFPHWLDHKKGQIWTCQHKWLLFWEWILHTMFFLAALYLPWGLLDQLIHGCEFKVIQIMPNQTPQFDHNSPFQMCSQFLLNFNISTKFHNVYQISPFEPSYITSTKFHDFNQISRFYNFNQISQHL